MPVPRKDSLRELAVGEPSVYDQDSRLEPYDSQMKQVLEHRNESLREMSQPLPGSRPYDNHRPINIPARLDRRTLLECVCALHPHIDPKQWGEWFRLGQILSDGQPVAPNRSVRGGEQFWHWFPDTVEPDVNADIRVIWEDDALVAIAKPAPLPVHPCGRFNRNTLTSLLDSVYGEGNLRLVHRLDANTTGVMVLARSKAVATNLRQQFEHNAIQKRYLVRILGQPNQDRIVCHQRISRQRSSAGMRGVDPEGLEATTEFRILERCPDGTSLAEAIPRTGRTNQIRIHLWSMQMPVMGDPTYLIGRRFAPTQTLANTGQRMCLHAWSLTLQHPDRNEAITLEAERPVWGQARAGEQRGSCV